MDPQVRKQQLYYARRELGLCVKCGMDVENPEKYVMCSACREKQRGLFNTEEMRTYRRNYQRNYREEVKHTLERIAIEVQKLSAAKNLRSDRKDIPKDHKCWDCVWGRWHGDRFFCPLVGCIKGPMKQEAAIENEHN